MSSRRYVLGLLYFIFGCCISTSTAIVVDNSTDCDYFATRTTINGTHDQCDCDADFTGNGTYCIVQAQVDCSSNVAADGYAIKVLINQTFIDYNGISTSALRLLNESCNNVTVEGGYYVLKVPEYDDCGNIQSNSTNAIVYSNAVLTNGGGISSGDVLRFDFSCFVSAFLSLSLSNDNGSAIQILASRAGSQIVDFPVQGGVGKVSASMFLYQDGDYKNAYNGVPVLSTTDTLYVKVALDTVLNGVFVISRECWATPDAAGQSPERFDIIENGCLKSSVTDGKLTSNGIEEESRFQLQVFTFLPSNVVYIHCSIQLCTNDRGTCQPSCPASRRKRDLLSSTRILRSSLIIKSPNNIIEPFTLPSFSAPDQEEPEEKTTDAGASTDMILIATLVSLVAVMVIIIVALFLYLGVLRRHKST